MESRRIVLLSQGYLDGRLSFEYKNPFSKIREEYFLDLMEKDIVCEALRIRAISDIIHGAAISNADVLKSGKDALREYTGLLLPYMLKTRKMESKNLTPDTIKELKAILQETKKAAGK